MLKRLFVYSASALTGLLLATQVNAQASIPVIATIDSVQAAQATACYQTQPLAEEPAEDVVTGQTANQTPRLWLPLISGPMCTELTGWSGAVAFISNGSPLPLSLDGTKLAISKANFPFSIANTALTTEPYMITATDPGDGPKKALLFAIKKEAKASSVNAPVPNSVLMGERALVYGKGLSSGAWDGKGRLKAFDLLYKKPTYTGLNNTASIASDCPAINDFSVPATAKLGFVTIEGSRYTGWVMFEHDATTITRCPNIAPFVYVEMWQFWANMPADTKVFVDVVVKGSTTTYYPTTLSVVPNTVTMTPISETESMIVTMTGYMLGAYLTFQAIQDYDFFVLLVPNP